MSARVRFLWLVVLVGALLWDFSCSLHGAYAAPLSTEKTSSVPGKWKRVEDFVRDHWAYPIPAMGPAPRSYKGEERSLRPQACGSCHPDQYKQWKTTVHSRAMSPGVYGQLIELWASDPEQARGCSECHAPLAEQQKKILVGTGPFAKWRSNPSLDHELEMAGLACAACHVRNWRVHGPPKRGTPRGVSDVTTSGKHGGVERTPFFERAEFCMKCHQHPFPGPNGKAIENTFNEWKASLWGRAGVQCQNCHMPRRQHLWRGIHDKEMAQRAVSVEVALDVQALKRVLSAEIKLINTGAGHYFPTYITPSVDVIAEQEDLEGRPIAGTRSVYVIERRLSADLSREIFDTRIPPQKSVAFRYHREIGPKAARLRVRVHVKPDAFYHNFFINYLKNPGLSEKSRKLIAEARDQAAGSAFDIYDKRFNLKGK